MTRVRIRIARTVPADPKIRRLPVKEPALQYRPVIIAAALVGFGMAGLVDSILFRELLQWHAVAESLFPVSGVSAPEALANLRRNLFWNGLYQAGAWIIAAAGVVCLWIAGLKRDILWSTRLFGGSVLLGWGAFKVIESLLVHYALGLHHVRGSPNAALWDIAYLALGIVLVLAGSALVRAELKATRPAMRP